MSRTFLSPSPPVALLLLGCGGVGSEKSSGALWELSADPRSPEGQRPSVIFRERRRDALARERLELAGPRDVQNRALEEESVGWPEASVAEGDAVLAIDGDLKTAWRGAGAGPWRWELPFHRPLHLGLLRFFFGDASDRGVPSAFHVEIQAPDAAGQCRRDAPWEQLPGGHREDRDPNLFLHGPREVHARHQALFADQNACALRLRIEASEGPPVLKELKILEGAPSVAAQGQVIAEGSLAGSDPMQVVDGTYEGAWRGAPGLDRWVLTLTLPEPRVVDRLWLALGEDGVTVADEQGAPGRRYTGAHLPLAYEIATAHDLDPGHLVPLPEAAAPRLGEHLLPVRRRLVSLDAPRPVQLVRVTITEATGPWGERERRLQAPMIRELRLYEASDPRPAITEPLFFSVSANPSGLTRNLQGGEANSDGVFARTLHHRLRRTLLGFDADTRWPADATRPRDAGTGRFLEVIEGDDPTLATPLLEALSPPPVLLLSGSFDWEFDAETRRWGRKPGHWSWDVDAPAGSPDRGMGQLREAIQGRKAPAVGFCGGAQILALLESMPPVEEDIDNPWLRDRVLARNSNEPIRGLISHRDDPYEHAWWFDKPALDALRPTMHFIPSDPLLGGAMATGRGTSRELPSSHGDMIRASAFLGPLRRLELVGWSHFCRDWVDPAGLENTWPDPSQPGRFCVKIPQAFRSRDHDGYPIVGFQFHPEQRDLQRLAPGSPPDARGDALNFIANTLSLILDAYTRLYWSRA